MNLVVSALGWSAVVLLSLILGRAYRRRLLRKFKVFYSYIAGDLAGSILVSLVRYGQPGYARWYWIVQFVTLFLGCAVLWQMFARTWLPVLQLRQAARIGQYLLLSLIALAAVRFVVIEAKLPFDNNAFRCLERDCRAAQAVFFTAIVFVIFRYGIPMGRNLKTICIGYGFYVLVSLVALAVSLYATAAGGVEVLCLYSQAASFDAAALIWLIGLWDSGDAFALSRKQTQIRARVQGVRLYYLST